MSQPQAAHLCHAFASEVGLEGCSVSTPCNQVTSRNHIPCIKLTSSCHRCNPKGQASSSNLGLQTIAWINSMRAICLSIAHRLRRGLGQPIFQVPSGLVEGFPAAHGDCAPARLEALPRRPEITAAGIPGQLRRCAGMAVRCSGRLQ